MNRYGAIVVVTSDVFSGVLATHVNTQGEHFHSEPLPERKKEKFTNQFLFHTASEKSPTATSSLPQS